MRDSIVRLLPRDHWALVGIAVAILGGAIFSTPPQRHGDASEFIVGVESLIYDHNLDVTLADAFRSQDLKPASVDTPAGLHAFLGNEGRYYLLAHSFYYPLALVPAHLALRWAGPEAVYRGYLGVNLLALAGILILLLRARLPIDGPKGAAFLTAAFVFGSAFPGYVFWIHPEVFSGFLVTAAVFCWLQGKLKASALLFGFLAGAQCPLGLGIFLVGASLLRERRRFKEWAAVAGLFLAVASPQYIFAYRVAGVLSSQAANGYATPTNFQFDEYLGAFFSPSYGLFWFYPFTLLAVIVPRRSWKALALWGYVAAAMAVLSWTATWSSHGIGFRYSAYFGPMLLLAVGEIPRRKWIYALCGMMLFFAGGLVMNPMGNAWGPLDERLFASRQLFHHLLGWQENIEYARSETSQYSWNLWLPVARASEKLLPDRDARFIIYYPRPGRLEFEFECFQPTHISFTLGSKKIPPQEFGAGKHFFTRMIKANEIGTTRGNRTYLTFTVRYNAAIGNFTDAYRSTVLLPQQTPLVAFRRIAMDGEQLFPNVEATRQLGKATQAPPLPSH